MMPTAFGPSECMRQAERMTIEELRRQNLGHFNKGAGGERIGKGYNAFLYVATNVLPSAATYEFNGLTRTLSVRDEQGISAK